MTAGSTPSRRLVAPNTKMVVSRCSMPSHSAQNAETISRVCTSLSVPLRLGKMASNSSTNMSTLLVAARARVHSSRTFFEALPIQPSPLRSATLTEINSSPPSRDSARAIKVLPVPLGPYKRRPGQPIILPDTNRSIRRTRSWRSSSLIITSLSDERSG
jgi:hypothetical protein